MEVLHLVPYFYPIFAEYNIILKRYFFKLHVIALSVCIFYFNLFFSFLYFFSILMMVFEYFFYILLFFDILAVFHFRLFQPYFLQNFIIYYFKAIFGLK